jgi:hypothetical protein
LLIEAYFQQVRELIDACPVIQLSDVAYDKRGPHEGLVRGEAVFVDGSVLQWREYMDVEETVERLMYSFQYMDAGKTLIFRYDNTGHHRKQNLSTYPHHKHQGRLDNVVAASAPDLSSILEEIQDQVRLP